MPQLLCNMFEKTTENQNRLFRRLHLLTNPIVNKWRKNISVIETQNVIHK